MTVNIFCRFGVHQWRKIGEATIETFGVFGPSKAEKLDLSQCRRCGEFDHPITLRNVYQPIPKAKA